MIGGTWTNALPYLTHKYWKEMLVWGLAWGLFGVAAGLVAAWLAIRVT